MTTGTPLPSPQPPQTSREFADGSSRRGALLAGAVIGVAALAASILGVSVLVGAQNDPSLDDKPALLDDEPVGDEFDDGEFEDGMDDDEPSGDTDDDMFADERSDEEMLEDEAEWAAFDDCIDSALGLSGHDSDSDLTDEQWDALEAQFDDAEQQCLDVLPEDVKAEWAAFAPYEECIDEQLAGVEFPDKDESELTDEEVAGLDATWEAADAACFDLLPEDVKADEAAFAAYDTCLADAGFDEEAWSGGHVYVESDDDGQSIVFGDAPATVTITSDGTGVSVATSGDVSILGDTEAEAAFESCDDLLPELDDEFDDEAGGDESDD